MNSSVSEVCQVDSSIVELVGNILSLMLLLERMRVQVLAMILSTSMKIL